MIRWLNISLLLKLDTHITEVFYSWKQEIFYIFFNYTLDALSASDLLLREREQQEKEQREREQQENQDWIELKNNNYINSRNQTLSESGMDPFSPSLNSF